MLINVRLADVGKTEETKMFHAFQMVTGVAVPPSDGGLRSSCDFIAPRIEHTQLSADDQVFPGGDSVSAAGDSLDGEHVDDSAERQSDFPGNRRGGRPSGSFAHGFASGKCSSTLLPTRLTIHRLNYYA